MKEMINNKNWWLNRFKYFEKTNFFTRLESTTAKFIKSKAYHKFIPACEEECQILANTSRLTEATKEGHEIYSKLYREKRIQTVVSFAGQLLLYPSLKYKILKDGQLKLK